MYALALLVSEILFDLWIRIKVGIGCAKGKMSRDLQENLHLVEWYRR